MTRLHEVTLASLRQAAMRFGALDGVARATLARRTALAVASAADRWVDAAVAIKAAGGASGPEVRAEETATGPLATLRLLVITAGCLREAAAHGTPLPAAPPRLVHRRGGKGGGTGHGGDAEFVAVEVLPKPRLADLAMFAGHSATVRCAVGGGLDSFQRVWRQEWLERPRRGGVAAILGAGNVTGLAVADAVSQIFEYGRAAAVKLHPLHEPLLPVFQAALAPLIDEGMLAIAAGGAEDAAALIGSPAVGHVHLTGGRGAFDRIVWGAGGPRPDGRPVLSKPVTCELGGVTPWIVVPGRYSDAQLGRQADFVAASILNNTSFNCIATKCLVTCRGWGQRSAFLDMVTRRLAAAPRRRAWYPGAAAAWEQVTESRPPADGTLPAVLRPEIDPVREPRWLEREWFVPVAVEVPIEADDIEAFCTRAAALTRGMPGNLGCSVTVPPALAAHDEQRVQLLVEHLEYGAVAVNTWVALAYAFASVPWGGFPGGTLAEPGSGIGFVHDPLCLPLVHNSIVRGPLCAAQSPPWLPWHRHGSALTRGAVDVYASLARGGTGLWPLVRMLPQVLAG